MVEEPAQLQHSDCPFGDTFDSGLKCPIGKFKCTQTLLAFLCRHPEGKQLINRELVQRKCFESVSSYCNPL